jgi:hypothetical protein
MQGAGNYKLGVDREVDRLPQSEKRHNHAIVVRRCYGGKAIK